jgi:hypothetical protein
VRSVSDVLQNVGGHVEFTTKDGKAIKVKYLTLKAMSEYENRLQNRAIRKLTEQRDVIPADIFSEMFSKLMDDIASGHYAFGGEICQKSLRTVDGVANLMSVLCGVSADEAIDLLVKEGDAFKTIFDEVVKKSIGSKDDEETAEVDEKKS